MRGIVFLALPTQQMVLLGCHCKTGIKKPTLTGLDIRLLEVSTPRDELYAKRLRPVKGYLSNLAAYPLLNTQSTRV